MDPLPPPQSHQGWLPTFIAILAFIGLSLFFRTLVPEQQQAPKRRIGYEELSAKVVRDEERLALLHRLAAREQDTVQETIDSVVADAESSGFLDDGWLRADALPEFPNETHAQKAYHSWLARRFRKSPGMHVCVSNALERNESSVRNAVTNCADMIHPVILPDDDADDDTIALGD